MARKKRLSLPLAIRRAWVVPSAVFSVRRQCRLAGVSRSDFYYEAAPESAENLLLMRRIDEQYMRHPEFGYPRMTDWLIDEGHAANHKRVARLMQLMGLQAITPGPHTSKPAPGHSVRSRASSAPDECQRLLRQFKRGWNFGPVLRRHLR